MCIGRYVGREGWLFYRTMGDVWCSFVYIFACGHNSRTKEILNLFMSDVIVLLPQCWYHTYFVLGYVYVTWWKTHQWTWAGCLKCGYSFIIRLFDSHRFSDACQKSLNFFWVTACQLSWGFSRVTDSVEMRMKRNFVHLFLDHIAKIA